MPPAELLRAAIKASGLSARRFAREVLTRDERTIRRWLRGDTPVPPAVVEFLERIAKAG
jgi:transcriptional regulator with XRE-family HTH domain